jgi:hypothetical protein
MPTAGKKKKKKLQVSSREASSSTNGSHNGTTTSTSSSGSTARTRLWNHSKFHSRIYVMREIYHCWIQNGRSLEGTEYDPCGRAHAAADGMSSTNDDNPKEVDDPFQDEIEDYMLGVARLQLEAINYMLDSEECTPLVDYKGQMEGVLQCGVAPRLVVVSGDANKEDDDDSNDYEIDDLKQVIGRQLELDISVKTIQNITLSGQYNTLYIRYRVFPNQEYCVTPTIRLVNHRKEVNKNETSSSQLIDLHYSHTLSFKVTAQLCDYFASGALGFEVWLSVGGGGKEEVGEDGLTLADDELLVCGDDDDDDEGEQSIAPPPQLLSSNAIENKDDNESAFLLKNKALTQDNRELKSENHDLKEQLSKAMRRIEELMAKNNYNNNEEGSPRASSLLETSKMIDTLINGNGGGEGV